MPNRTVNPRKCAILYACAMAAILSPLAQDFSEAEKEFAHRVNPLLAEKCFSCHGNLVRQVDQPIAALITDLKQRDLLKDTLIVWCGEFGRSPDNGVRDGTAFGRDHNPKAMTIWLAGGGVNAGHTIGATDTTGAEAVECVHHVRDLHVTLLHLLGLDDNKLTYFHGGRFKQLSQFGGKVIRELIA